MDNFWEFLKEWFVWIAICIIAIFYIIVTGINNESAIKAGLVQDSDGHWVKPGQPTTDK